MSKAAWDRLGYGALAVVTFICTLVVIRWTLNFVTWASIDSGWMQAIGSIAALGIAIYVMSRQSADAIRLVADTDRRALRRRASAVLELMKNAESTIGVALLRIEQGLGAGEPSHIILGRTSVATHSFTEARNALTAIPLHELGSEGMVLAILNMVECLVFLDKTFEEWRANGPQLFMEVLAQEVIQHYRGMASKCMAQYMIGSGEFEDESQ